MKWFIFADVHGYYEELMNALMKKGFEIDNPNHGIISLGDLLDRGPDAVKCLQFVNNLPFNRKILIIGNHEDLMLTAMVRQCFVTQDYHNGTADTAYQISDYLIDQTAGKDWDLYSSNEAETLKMVADSKLWRDYILNTVDYAEIGNNVFVHGWIPTIVEHTCDGYRIYNPVKDWRNSDLWYSARWINGMDAWNNGIRLEGKTIWCGHWHTSWGHAHLHNDGVEFLKKVETYYTDEKGVVHPYAKFTTFEDDGIMALDACTAYSGFVNCEVIEVE